MKLNKFILQLQQLAAKHGEEVEVVAWHYAGGEDLTFSVEATYDTYIDVIDIYPFTVYGDYRR